MQDRVPVNPGRVLISPENGSAAYYATMTRADNPTQEGTPLNKANLLKDATAALFGLGADAVPDDVLNAIKTLIDGANANANKKAKIATGSYTGTGDSGTAYKNTLTFDFVPKAVIVHGYVYGGHGSVTMLYGSTYLKDSIYTNYNSVDLTISWSEKTVSWYGTSAVNQMNYSGQKYQYLAIG